MRKIIYAILFSIFFIGCASTNIEKKAPVSSENLHFEAFIKKYAGYDELVERGFDIHSLDYVTTPKEIMDAFRPYFYDYEDGRAFDNHFSFHGTDGELYHIVSDTKIAFRQGYYDEYGLPHYTTEPIFGTKEELLAQGFIENKTMFYYPINGEKDWVVGWEANRETPAPDLNSILPVEPYSIKEMNNIIYLKIREHSINPSSYNDFYSKAQNKEVIIVDLIDDDGGSCDDGMNIASKLLSLKKKNKKIYVLIGRNTRSCGECLAYYLKEHQIKLIGQNTQGSVRYGNINNEWHKFPKIGISKMLLLTEVSHPFNIPNAASIEGIGVFPDYWVIEPIDIVKIINWDLGYNLLTEKVISDIY